MAEYVQSGNTNIGESLAAQSYVRSRLAPRPGEDFYLTLSDLVLAWREAVASLSLQGSRILDLGCGGSPYRELFAGAQSYVRADISGTPDLDFTMDDVTGRTLASEDSFDIVISSQVLEHVESPADYLAEAHRLLRTGGTLLLSTHGTFQDHPCPGDYWRWTGMGLRKVLSEAGFEVVKLLYLTTGPRAALGLLELNMPHLPLARGWLVRMLFYLPRQIWVSKSFRRWMHRMVDKAFPGARMVEGLPPFRGLYFVLFAVARKVS